jgi:signal transduction histidine kinase
MTRAVLAYLLFVLAPAAALALLALRVADKDLEENEHALESRLGEEAAALARRVEAVVSDAVVKAKEASVVGYAKDGRWMGYSLEPPAEREPATPEELRLYDLSVQGGESYELGQKDPARALDAYAFFLPRIRSPLLRSRLDFRIARAALACGDKALGEAIFKKLFEQAAGLTTEEGLPLDLLAAERLELALAARDRLREDERSLSTPLLRHFVEALAPQDPGLSRVLEERRALEEAVSRHPEIVTSLEAALEERFLLLQRPVEQNNESFRSIVCVPIELPRLAAGDLEARLDFESGAKAPKGATRPVHLREGGSPLARIQVWDPKLEAKLATLSSRRTLLQALVGLLVLVTLGGGIALVRFIARERNLAKLRARLLANVSHELKTPVTSIRMFSEMLAEDPLDEGRTRRFGELLCSESLRLSQLVENLLDFSRLGRREVELMMEPVDLKALLRQVAEGFAYRAREKGVDFTLGGFESREKTDKRPELILQTNAAAVERILLNLLDNALKYRRPEKASIRLETREADGRVRVSVADNGVGIPPKDRERVFEEFYRVRYDDYAVQGSGLGLSIARRLARKLGGDITLESRVGEGSTFTLELAKLPVDEPPIAKDPGEAA